MMMILFAEPANFLFDDGGQSQGVSNFVLQHISFEERPGGLYLLLGTHWGTCYPRERRLLVFAFCKIVD